LRFWPCDHAGWASQQRITNTENNFFIVTSNSLQCHLLFHALPYIAAIPRQVRPPGAS
jgi:hypothetical protein